MAVFCTIGIINKDVGKATIKPIKKPLIHIQKNIVPKPALMAVKVRDIEKDMNKDINRADRSPEYFLFTFTF